MTKLKGVLYKHMEPLPSSQLRGKINRIHLVIDENIGEQQKKKINQIIILPCQMVLQGGWGLVD